MDATTAVAFVLLGFLFALSFILSAIDSAKVKALEVQIHELENELMGEEAAYKLGHGRGYTFGCIAGFRHCQEPWVEEFAHVADLMEAEDE